MSEGSQSTKTVADYEATLSKADTSVASFEHEHMTPLQKLRIFLQAYPVSVPIFVLILSVLLFGITTDGRIFLPGNLSTILKQVTPIGIVGDRPDHHHPHRRHRPLDRRHHGAVHHRHGQARRAARACRSRWPSPSACLPAVSWAISTASLVTQAAAAALHRHARHALHLPGPQALVFGIRIDPQRRYGGHGPAADLLRQGDIGRQASRSSMAPSPSCCSPSSCPTC